jgi:hypothetical protein
MRDIIIQAVILALLSAIFIAQGLRILTAKRPFIVSQPRTVILELAPAMAILIWALWPSYQAQSRLDTLLVVGAIFLLFCGLTIMLGTILWSLRRGIVVVVGTTEPGLRDALRHALRRLSLSYEESVQAFHLPTLKNELMVEAGAINGMFALRPKKFGNRHEIRQLAVEIDGFFRTVPAQTNRRLSYALVVIGAAILLLGSGLTYARLSLESKMRATRGAHTGFFKSPEK